MNFQQRVDALVQLGNLLKDASWNGNKIFETAKAHNPWFTADNIKLACGTWADTLIPEKLAHWLAPYNISGEVLGPHGIKEEKVAIIMAGNIPLVGLHDLLCVLALNQTAIVKLSSDDTILMQWVIKALNSFGFEGKIIVSEERIPKDYDKVIATGSDNSNRYFKSYFGSKPHLLRGSRHSVAVITGKETREQLSALQSDIFSYFGKGCRNVSKLYIPQGFDLALFFEAIEPSHSIIHHNKYANNYTYHKAIFLMNLTKHLDNGFLLVKEDERIASPLSVLFYEEYNGWEDVVKLLDSRKNEIQCVVSSASHQDWYPLGHAQSPELWDYSDGINTLSFVKYGN